LGIRHDLLLNKDWTGRNIRKDMGANNGRPQREAEEGQVIMGAISISSNMIDDVLRKRV
jgi:hypothetical protein